MQVLGMPYKADHLTMFVLLPKQRFGLAELEKKLSGTRLLQLMEKTSLRNVIVSDGLIWGNCLNSFGYMAEQLFYFFGMGKVATRSLEKILVTKKSLEGFLNFLTVRTSDYPLPIGIPLSRKLKRCGKTITCTFVMPCPSIRLL